MNFAFKMMNSALYVMHSALKMSHSVEGGYPYRAPGYCTIDHLCVPTFNSGSFSGCAEVTHDAKRLCGASSTRKYTMWR